MTVDKWTQCMLLVHGFSLYVVPLLLQYDEGLNNIAEKSEAN